MMKTIPIMSELEILKRRVEILEEGFQEIIALIEMLGENVLLNGHSCEGRNPALRQAQGVKNNEGHGDFPKMQGRGD